LTFIIVVILPVRLGYTARALRTIREGVGSAAGLAKRHAVLSMLPGTSRGYNGDVLN
jgi:hypothetical protein